MKYYYNQSTTADSVIHTRKTCTRRYLLLCCGQGGTSRHVNTHLDKITIIKKAPVCRLIYTENKRSKLLCALHAAGVYQVWRAWACNTSDLQSLWFDCHYSVSCLCVCAAFSLNIEQATAFICWGGWHGIITYNEESRSHYIATSSLGGTLWKWHYKPSICRPTHCFNHDLSHSTSFTTQAACIL